MSKSLCYLMKKNKKSLKRDNKAVSDMVGTILLLLMAVTIFSFLYLAIFSFQEPAPETSVNIIGKVNLDDNILIFEHHGGEKLDLNNFKLEVDIAGQEVPNIFDEPLITYDFYNINGEPNNDDFWNIGEVLIFYPSQLDPPINNLDNLYIKYYLKNLVTNSLDVIGPIQPGIEEISSINLPTIQINYPNGGQTFHYTDTINIDWTSTSGDGTFNGIDLKYSLNNGVSWNPILTLTTNPGSYNWDISSTMPDVNSTNCLIQATIHYLASDSDTSDNKFTIYGINPEPPTNVIVSQFMSVAEEFLALPNSLVVKGDEINNDYTATHVLDTTYHTISEIKYAGSPELEVVYDFKLSDTSYAPYYLNINGYNPDQEAMEVYYSINNGSYMLVPSPDYITRSVPSQDYDTWILDGVQPGDYIKILINDSLKKGDDIFPDDAPQPISTLFINYVNISSTSLGTSDNQIVWVLSDDDGAGYNDVSHYDIYSSENGPDPAVWDFLASEPAGSNMHVHLAAGNDGITWYYKIIAVDTYGSESTPAFGNEQ